MLDPFPPRYRVDDASATSFGPLRLVRPSLGVVAPFAAHVLAHHPTGSVLVELVGPDNGRVATFEPFELLERLHGHVAAPDTEAIAALDNGQVSIVWRNGASVRAGASAIEPWNRPIHTLHHNDDPVVDALRRSLALDTAPSNYGPAWYWLLVWLHDLATLADKGSIGVIEAARWHPALEPDDIADADDPDEVTERCLDQLYEHARMTRWEGVRAGAIDGWLDLGSCPPDLARWFDAASFGRALQAQLGSPIDHLERLAQSDFRLTDAAIDMFRLMIAGLDSVRAMDCHR